MKQNPWACLRAASAIHHSRCALAFASHDTAKAHAYVLIERIAAKRSESKAYACALTVPWLAVHPIAHTAKSPVTLDDCKTEKYNRIANEFNILI